MAKTAPTGKKKLDKHDKIIAKATAISKHGTMETIPVKEMRFYSSVFGWDPDKISSALAQHDQGFFRQSETLYQGMRRIPRIEAASKTRCNFIRTLPFRIVDPEDTPPAIKDYNKFVEKNFDFIVSPNELSEIIARTIWFGFCFAKITWSGLDGRILPRLQVFTHYYLQYNYAHNQYMIVTDDNQIQFISPEDPSWLFFTSGGIRPWLNGIIRAMGHSYAMTIHAMDRWMAFNDTEATAIKVLKTPAQAREQIEKDIAMMKVAALRGGDAIPVPNGYEFDLVTTNGRGDAYKTYKDIIDKSDADAAILLLGHNLSQEVKGGSLAAAKQAGSISRELYIGDLANLLTLSKVLKQAIYRNFNRWQFADLPSDLSQYAGKPEWCIDQVKDPEINADLAVKNAQSLASFIATANTVGLDLKALDIDWIEQAKKCGIVLSTAK